MFRRAGILNLRVFQLQVRFRAWTAASATCIIRAKSFLLAVTPVCDEPRYNYARDIVIHYACLPISVLPFPRGRFLMKPAFVEFPASSPAVYWRFLATALMRSRFSRGLANVYIATALRSRTYICPHTFRDVRRSGLDQSFFSRVEIWKLKIADRTYKRSSETITGLFIGKILWKVSWAKLLRHRGVGLMERIPLMMITVSRHQPGTCFRKLIDLILKVDNDLLMLLAQEMCGLLTLKMDIFE